MGVLVRIGIPCYCYSLLVFPIGTSMTLGECLLCCSAVGPSMELLLLQKTICGSSGLPKKREQYAKLKFQIIVGFWTLPFICIYLPNLVYWVGFVTGITFAAHL